MKDEKISKWIVNVLRARTMDTQKADRERRAELRCQISVLEGQRDRLVNLRLVDEIEAETFSAKNLEIKDRLATLKLKLDACDRGGDEFADLAVKAIELSQRLAEKWLVADYSANAKYSKSSV